MDVTFAFLADAANVSREGKLNILGLFDVIHAASFPATHPQMQLVVRFEAAAVEAGHAKRITIKFVDEDGKALFEAGASLTLARGVPGERIRVDHVLSIAAMRFEKAGTYEFKVFVDGEPKRDVPLRVVQLPTRDINVS